MTRDELDRAVRDIRIRFFSDPFHVFPETELTDLLDRFVIDRLGRDREDSGGCTVLAAGGFGRRTLHPASDLDFLILFRDSSDADVVGRLLDRLGDPGFEIGYQAKQFGDFSVFDPAEVDGYTAFFDARYLWGDAGLAREFTHRVLPGFVSDNQVGFLRAMIEVRAARHCSDREGIDSPEPNVKTGVGGLRDYHFVRWVSHVLGSQPPPEVESAAAFIQRVRNLLHYLEGRSQDVLRIEYQDEISARLRYGVEPVIGLMRDYRRAAVAILRASVEAEVQAMAASK